MKIEKITDGIGWKIKPDNDIEYKKVVSLLEKLELDCEQQMGTMEDNNNF